MKNPLTRNIYDALEAHCGGETKIIGNVNTIRQMKNGDLNPTLNTLRGLFEANGLPAELTIITRVDGKKGKTKIKL